MNMARETTNRRAIDEPVLTDSTKDVSKMITSERSRIQLTLPSSRSMHFVDVHVAERPLRRC